MFFCFVSNNKYQHPTLIFFSLTKIKEHSLSLKKIKSPLMIFARVHYKITTIYFYLEHFICRPADKRVSLLLYSDYFRRNLMIWQVLHTFLKRRSCFSSFMVIIEEPEVYINSTSKHKTQSKSTGVLKHKPNLLNCSTGLSTDS